MRRQAQGIDGEAAEHRRLRRKKRPVSARQQPVASLGEKCVHEAGRPPFYKFFPAGIKLSPGQIIKSKRTARTLSQRTASRALHARPQGQAPIIHGKEAL